MGLALNIFVYKYIAIDRLTFWLTHHSIQIFSEYLLGRRRLQGCLVRHADTTDGTGEGLPGTWSHPWDPGTQESIPRQVDTLLLRFSSSFLLTHLGEQRNMTQVLESLVQVFKTSIEVLAFCIAWPYPTAKIICTTGWLWLWTRQKNFPKTHVNEIKRQCTFSIHFVRPFHWMFHKSKNTCSVPILQNYIYIGNTYVN